jgi:hypothetical protein
MKKTGSTRTIFAQCCIDSVRLREAMVFCDRRSDTISVFGKSKTTEGWCEMMKKAIASSPAVAR